MTTTSDWAKKLAAAVAACLAFGGTQGFAASLSAGTDGFGATTKIVGACGAGLTIGYTTAFDAAISGYAVNRIDLSNIPADCLGKTLKATFYSDDGSATGSAISTTLPASGTSESVPIDTDTNTIDANHVGGISVVVA